MQKKLTIRVFIQKYILLKINYNEWKSGDKIPSENTLAIKFNCSRITVRNILQNLVYNGYLTSIKGKGYFICETKNNGQFKSLDLEYNSAYAKINTLKKGQVPFKQKWIELLKSNASKVDLDHVHNFEKFYYSKDNQKIIYKYSILNREEVLLYDQEAIAKSLTKYLLWQGISLNYSYNVVIFDNEDHYDKIASELGWSKDYPLIISILSNDHTWVELSAFIIAKSIFSFSRMNKVTL